ncbi:MAG: tetratricopeptide repeat protein [Candidatus Paceibacterota bacterium]
MQRNIFSPKVEDASEDTLSVFFHKASLVILVGTFGLLPVLFIPGVFAPIGFTKVLFLSIGLFASLIFACLGVLRSGKVRTYLPLPLTLFWGFSLFSLVSALLSGDVSDSLYGAAFEVHTAGFMIIMAMIMTMALVISGSKKSFSRFFWLLTVSVSLVLVHYLSRLALGTDFLSFGIFNSNSISIIGNLNDLALLAGLVLVFVLMTANKFSESYSKMAVVSVITIFSLMILATANFSFIWMILGFVSLLTFLYLVAKDTWLKPTNEETLTTPVSRFVMVLVATVCVVSGAFVVSGDYLGQKVTELTGVSYLEVRPSLSATFAITQHVYQDNILLGAGPNRFEDAWRQYKDPVINETQFWNTNFSSGNGFVSTLFVTTGLVGVVLFLVFFLSFLYLGYKLVFVSKVKSSSWNFVGTLAFVSACYLWLMTFLYTPGAFVMSLVAIATGLTLAVWVQTRPEAGAVINVAYSKQHGFLLIASAVVVIVTATALFINVNQKYSAQVAFADAIVELSTTNDLAEYDKSLIKASEHNPKQDIYVVERARLRLAELNRLRTLTDPTENDQAEYVKRLEEGIELARLAVTLDPSNPFNQALLGSFYGFIGGVDNVEVLERRNEAFARAKSLDPTNPEYAVLEAQLASQLGDLATARTSLNEAVKLKSNYTDALYLLSQLDIQEGNATSAIATTLSIISIEPNNPGRYFQLGILLLANNNLSDAIISFETAVALDPNYANARYMLALSYLDTNRIEEALVQLKTVEVSNPDNQELKALIAQVEGGDYVRPDVGSGVPVKDASATAQEGDVTVTMVLLIQI